MILVITKKATENDVKKMAEDFGGLYIKVVVDIEQEILAGGGERHYQAEELLLQEGSQQVNLWGGGIEVKTHQIDYNSMINLRPGHNNSRDILSEKIRKKFDTIVKKLLL